MEEERVRELVLQLDTTSFTQIDAAWEELGELGEAAVPILAQAYRGMRRWQGRAALVYYSIPFARTSRAAFELGLAAVSDRATLVRYRACMLLAYSLSAEALPALEQLLCHTDPKTVEDARAAIDAIQHRNHHYFVDRDHTGRMRWEPNFSEYLQTLSSEAAQETDAQQQSSADQTGRKAEGAAGGCAEMALLVFSIVGGWMALPLGV